MPELNVAPSPSPVVAAPDSAAAAKPSNPDAANIGNDDSEAASPFATVLKQQMEQPAQANSVKAIEAVLAAGANIEGQPEGPDNAATTVSDATAAADALAFLAPMLAGIAPATSEQGRKASAKDDDKKDDASAVIAAAVPIAVVAVGTPQTSAQGTTGSTQTRTATDTAGRTAANLAAGTALLAENADSAGKSRSSAQESFDSLLSASREAMLASANHASAAHTSHVSDVQAATTAVQVSTPVGSPGWDSEVGEKIVWMANRLDTHAELVLNPPHLGRIEVSISMSGDQASASFVSANPAVREALENAVPRLREIMQDAGISLGQTQVGAESFQQSANNRENGDNPSRNGSNIRDSGVAASGGLIGGGSASTRWLRHGNGLVDTFA